MNLAQIILTTVPLAFAMIFFFIYLFYPRAKENLIFTVLSVSMAANIYLNLAEDTTINVTILRLVTLVSLCVALNFLYVLFYKKPLKLFYYYTSASAVFMAWILIDPAITDNPVLYLFFLIGAAEIIRVIVLAIVRKRGFAWILGIAILLIAIMSVYEILMDIFKFSPLLGEEDPGVFAQTFMLLMMAVYLAQRFAKTRTDLANRSDELERLNIELEERVAERTEELAEANRALERHNIDITKSRDQIEKTHQELQKTHEELRKAQSRLVQSEKMASLGNLAAGVAHEINTPVGAVNSAADTSKRAIDRVVQTIEKIQSKEDISTDQKFHDALKFIKSNNDIITLASERIVKIVKSLRNFARLDEAEYKEADIHEGIDSTLILLHHMTRDRIEIVKEYGDIPRISCRPSQLNQVFMNLLKNAAEAIPKEGTIRIQTSTENGKVLIRISDDGPGIDDEDLKRIFDPGFTTKGVGVGTGLGLSISYNIIDDHNGEIQVVSEKGKGSTFMIFLPVKQD
ncbi:sensor histidine kinase [Acidobacteriota bacterium]